MNTFVGVFVGKEDSIEGISELYSCESNCTYHDCTEETYNCWKRSKKAVILKKDYKYIYLGNYTLNTCDYATIKSAPVRSLFKTYDEYCKYVIKMWGLSVNLDFITDWERNIKLKVITYKAGKFIPMEELFGKMSEDIFKKYVVHSVDTCSVTDEEYGVTFKEYVTRYYDNIEEYPENECYKIDSDSPYGVVVYEYYNEFAMFDYMHDTEEYVHQLLDKELFEAGYEKDKNRITVKGLKEYLTAVGGSKKAFLTISGDDKFLRDLITIEDYVYDYIPENLEEIIEDFEDDDYFYIRSIHE